MVQVLTQKAIANALKGKWKEALAINVEILNKSPNDIDALNRLARAYSELGDFAKAKKITKQVLKIDRYNKIAQKGLEKWKNLKKGETTKSGKISATLFLEEPGKTKIINLLNISSQKTLAKIDSGDELEFNLHGHKVSVITKDSAYIGKLPDDVGAKLKKLIKMGNKYKVLAKSIKPNEVKVFVKEIVNTPKTANIPSFSTEKINYIPFTAPELVHKRSELISENEEE